MYATWNYTPSAGQVFDPVDTFSEASLLEYYYNDFLSTPSLLSTLEYHLNTSYSTKLDDLDVKVFSNKNLTFDRRKHSLSFMESNCDKSKVLLVNRKDAVNKHAILFYCSLEESREHRGAAAGLVGWTIMLYLIDIILHYEIPTHPLQHPVIFFFDAGGPADGFSDLYNFMNSNQQYVIIIIIII